MPVEPPQVTIRTRRKRRRRKRSPVLVLLAIPVLCLGLVAIPLWVSQLPRPQTPNRAVSASHQSRNLPVPLSAIVYEKGIGVIVVEHTGDRDWIDMQITINRKYQGDLVHRVRPGDVLKGGLLTFVDSEGRRFQPTEQAVIHLEINATTKDGPGVYTWDGRL